MTRSGKSWCGIDKPLPNVGDARLCHSPSMNTSVSTALKVMDILVMCLVPVPEMARSREQQDEYEQQYGEKKEGDDMQEKAMDTEET